MAAPQPQYPPQGYPQDEYNPEDGQEAYNAGGMASPPPPAAGGVAPGGAAGRKKRAYAGQAYEFGAGANSALGGQQQGGGQLGGYSAQTQAPAPAQTGYPVGYGEPQSATPQGYPQPEAAGGYQPPGPQYPTAQMANMGINDKQAAPPPQPAAGAARLNQLYPTDLLNQPFNVAELDYPPPPGNLTMTQLMPWIH